MTSEPEKLNLGACVADFVTSYEFDADDCHHVPDDNERALLTDALHGFIAQHCATIPVVAEAGEDDEYMSVSIDRAGIVTSHNAYDADFDEMVTATQAIIRALQARLDNRLACPFAAGKALLGRHPLDRHVIAEAGLRKFAPHLPRYMRQAFFDAVDAATLDNTAVEVERLREALAAEDDYWAASRAYASALPRLREATGAVFAAASDRRDRARAAIATLTAKPG